VEGDQGGASEHGQRRQVLPREVRQIDLRLSLGMIPRGAQSKPMTWGMRVFGF